MKVVVGSVTGIFTMGYAALAATAEGAVLGATRIASLRRLGMARNAAKAVRFNKYLNFGGKLNYGAAAGDLVAQLATNGFKINEVIF